MNPMQRRRMLEATEPAAPAGVGHWLAGSRLEMSGKIWPRGATIPDPIVEAIPPFRLTVLISNKLIVRRLGPPPAEAPRSRAIVQSDPKAERAAIQAAMRRDGYAEYELDHRVKPPPGAYKAAHPSTAIRAGEPLTNGRRP